MSFGSPISLGTEAYNELMDFELETPMSNEEVFDRLNSSNVVGFRVNKVEDVIGKASIMEEYTIMVYEIESEEEIITKLETLLNQEEIVEVKEKKGKVTTRNLKERIKSFRREILLSLSNSMGSATTNSLASRLSFVFSAASTAFQSCSRSFHSGEAIGGSNTS